MEGKDFILFLVQAKVQEGPLLSIVHALKKKPAIFFVLLNLRGKKKDRERKKLVIYIDYLKLNKKMKCDYKCA